MRHRGLIIVGIVTGVVVAMAVVGFAARDSIASFAGKKVMAQRGMDCGNLAVHVPANPFSSPIMIEPMRCEVARGPLRSVHFQAPLYVHLAGMSLHGVDCASVDIDLRPTHRQPVQQNTLGNILGVVGFNQPAVELMFDAADMSRMATPPFTAGRASIGRDGHDVIDMRDMHITSAPGEMHVTSPAAVARQAAILGEATLDSQSTPDHSSVTLVFRNHARVEVVLEHATEARPHIRFDVNPHVNASIEETNVPVPILERPGLGSPWAGNVLVGGVNNVRFW